jgi:hypothetical protein
MRFDPGAASWLVLPVAVAESARGCHAIESCLLLLRYSGFSSETLQLHR